MRRRRREGDRERWWKEEAGGKEGGKEGGREGRKEGGREGGRELYREGGREGEREKRMDRNTNCFVQLHTTQNLIPRQKNGMRVYTQGHCCNSGIFMH